MDAGDNIVFIHEGRKWWQGTKDELLDNDNAELNDFIFASGLMRQVRKSLKGR